MIGVAAGLAAGGKIPFASTFGRFLERGLDQIEMAIIGGANIKLVGTHVGVTLASDGPSQMALADVGFVRALAHVRDVRGNPAITVLTPSDAVSTYALVLAMAAFPSACYLRAVRADLPILYAEGDSFPFGGHRVLRRPEAGKAGGGIVLVAAGYMVHSALKAADALQGQGIAVTVVDAYALPMDDGAGAGARWPGRRHPGDRGQLCRGHRQRTGRSGGGTAGRAAGAWAGRAPHPQERPHGGRRAGLCPPRRR